MRIQIRRNNGKIRYLHIKKKISIGELMDYLERKYQIDDWEMIIEEKEKIFDISESSSENRGHKYRSKELIPNIIQEMSKY